jgi:hypothetical protein
MRAVLLPAAVALLGCGKPPTPESLVRKMSDRLAAAKTFSFSTSESHERRRGDGKVQVRHSRDFLVRRPDAVAFKVTSGERLGGGAYDGKSFTMVWPEDKVWAQVKMPATIDKSLDRLAERFGLAMPVGDLLHASPYDVLMSPDAKGTMGAKSVVEGKECDQVSFTEARVDWQLWIAREGDPVPCQIEITTKGRSGPLTSRVTFKNWNLAAAVTNATFEVQVPEGFERIGMVAHDPEPAGGDAAATPPAPAAK